VCIDELHRGDYTLLLATDPLADQVGGFLLVKTNDQAHRRRFLRTLQYGGFQGTSCDLTAPGMGAPSPFSAAGPSRAHD
jgi:hypothetical protein